MNLSDIVSKAGPILGGLLVGGPVGGGLAALKVLASEFGVEPEEDAVLKAIKADPEAAVKIKQLELDHKGDLQRMVLENDAAQQAQVNMTMRVEAASGHRYQRNWRPTIGYVVAFQFFLLGVAVFTVAIAAVQAETPEEAKALFDGMAAMVASMVIIITAECAVLGVNIKQRSNDKAVSQGSAPGPGLIASIFKK